MQDKKFKLMVHPVADEMPNNFKNFYFVTLVEMLAAKNACADLLIYLQDKLCVMGDHSNMFVITQFIDGDWVEIDEHGNIEE